MVDFNGQHFWNRLLDSLSDQTFSNFELIVVDNGGHLELPESHDGIRIKVLNRKENLGFSAGCNLGVSASVGDWVVFLNNDTVVEKNWLECLFSKMISNVSVGAVVSKIVFYPRYTRLRISVPTFKPSDTDLSSDSRSLGVRVRFSPRWDESTGLLNLEGFHGKEIEGNFEWRWTSEIANVCIPCFPRETTESQELIVSTPHETVGETASIEIGEDKMSIPIDCVQHVFGLEKRATFDIINSAGSELEDDGTCREEGIYKIDSGQYDIPREVTAFSGCSVMIRRDLFEELGGFDPKFFAYYEDTDLSWRMRKAGWKIMYEPKSVVRHHRSGTSGEQSPFFCFHIYRNMRWNVAKNARLRRALPLLLMELFSWIPSSVNTNNEFSALRLKRETIAGMVKYLVRRLTQAIG